MTAPTKSALLECPDCGNSGSIYLAGSVMPCPLCSPDAYNAALYAERINTGEETE